LCFLSLFWSQLLSWRCPKSKAPCSPSSTSFDQTAVILCNKVRTFVEFSAVKFNYDAKTCFNCICQRIKRLSHEIIGIYRHYLVDVCLSYVQDNGKHKQRQQHTMG
jgi:hypothetical protein